MMMKRGVEEDDNLKERDVDDEAEREEVVPAAAVRGMQKNLRKSL